MKLPTPQDLRERRTDLELTQSELADRADVSQPLIARIEGGDVDPRLSTLRRIVEALDEAEGTIVRAADLMNEDIVSVDPDDSITEANRQMQSHGFSQLPVIDDGDAEGIITLSDVAHAGEDVGDDPVREHMDESIATVSRDDTLDKVSDLLDHYIAVFVTERGRTVGIITEADVAARVS